MKSKKALIISVVAVIAFIAAVAVVMLKGRTDKPEETATTQLSASIQSDGKYSEEEAKAILYEGAVESLGKIQLKVDKFDSGEEIRLDSVSADFSDLNSPVFYMHMEWVSGELSGMKATAMIDYGGSAPETYIKYEKVPDAYADKKEEFEGTVIKNEDDSFIKQAKSMIMFFNVHEGFELLNKNGYEAAKYLRTESVDSTGDALLFSDGENGCIWIDADTGCLIRLEDNGKVRYSVSEIITGDSVNLPEIDTTKV